MNNISQSSQRLQLGASIEISVRQAAESLLLQSLIPAGTRIYLPDLGTDADQLLVRAARRLTDMGHVPVPHLAVRRCPSSEHLHARLSVLTQEAGVRDILLIGGDRATPAGPFAQTIDVLQAGVIDKYGLTDVAVAGHPEGRTFVSPAAEFDLLRLKQEFAKRTDLRMRIVTQFGFDPEVFLDWSEKVRLQGVDLPVHVGVAGPAKLTTLIKYGMTCGVGNSLSFLRKRAGALTALVGNYSPNEMVRPIEDHVRVHLQTAISQFHVYPFGGIEKSTQWLRDRGIWQ